MSRFEKQANRFDKQERGASRNRRPTYLAVLLRMCFREAQMIRV
jgi:hypothetical protein